MPVPRTNPTPQVSVMQQISDELSSGPFSILSDAARSRIYLLAAWAMRDGYERGQEAATKTPQKRPPHGF